MCYHWEVPRQKLSDFQDGRRGGYIFDKEINVASSWTQLNWLGGWGLEGTVVGTWNHIKIALSLVKHRWHNQ